MHIVIAPDSFKESLTAYQAATAIEQGILAIDQTTTITKVPMADGGEGTVQSLVDATGGTLKQLTVQGPRQAPVEAFYGLSGDGKVAVIEMAAASGLDKLTVAERNPEETTTYGVGELIKDALDAGVEEILLGIGGSATNDGGAGMVVALGGQLLNKAGEPIVPTGGGLSELATIDLSQLHPRIPDVTFNVACDVDNPLTGPQGASAIYGPQKGATEQQIERLDQNLTHYAKVIETVTGKAVDQVPGAGAAGGLGAGLLAFLGAELKRGGDLMVELLNLETKIKQADLVITGEGGINHQTIYGKTPIAVSKVAKKYHKPVIVLSGCINSGFESVYDHGVDAVFSIIPELTTLEEALQRGSENLTRTARNVMAVLKLSQ
ncbi:glycerate kinase [Amphibacillus cookii]|uniref:glycerate kinase n=1 Tax=Amphibacillus cookii TaxID=767787 RepID=UPI00195C561C|nr:glycerate kinase [Amphibacillus cookii]MBM7539797.1 glycerate kinase [Amphibacillus cookii]